MHNLWPNLLNLNEFDKSAISIEKSMRGREELRRKLTVRQQKRRRYSRRSRGKATDQKNLQAGSRAPASEFPSLEMEGNKLYENLLEPEDFEKADIAKAKAIAKAPPEDLKNMLLSI
jgi:hypothetical protein